MKIFNNQTKLKKNYDFVILLKTKASNKNSFNYAGSFLKKYLPDMLETFKTLQKVNPENSSEISRKSGNCLIGLKPLDGLTTVIFSGNMQYFLKIHRIIFLKSSQSGKF